MNLKVILSALAGAAIGAAGAAAIHAQAKVAARCVVAEVEITDAAKFQEYAQKVPAIVAAHGGHHMIRGGAITPLEGAAPKRLTVIQFDSVEEAKGFEDSPTVATSATQARTFHIRGTIRSTSPGQPLEGVVLTFKGDEISKAASTDRRGIYNADLPVGAYSVTVKPADVDLEGYERPLFRVASPETVTLNISLDPIERSSCDLMPLPGSSHIPDDNDAKDACGGSDVFPAPSEDGVPLQLLIRFGHRQRVERGYDYGDRWGSSLAPSFFRRPVFVAYNLFTLRADHVEYDEHAKTIQATGHVSAVDSDGATQNADSMNFKIEDGQAIPLR